MTSTFQASMEKLAAIGSDSAVKASAEKRLLSSVRLPPTID